MMENNRLSFILTQFENVSIEKLKDNYSRNFNENKIGELYFSNDFEHYSKVYLASNGLSTIEWRKTIISELPTNIQQTINLKLIKSQQESQESKLKKEQEIEENRYNEELISKEQLFTLLTCEDFNEGFALVSIYSEKTEYGHEKKLFGYINEKGEYEIEPKYEEAFQFNDGFALVRTNSKIFCDWEFINEKGLNVFDKKFEDARSFSGGFAAVELEDKGYGFIDKTGNLICDPQYNEVGDFKEGMARVKFNNKWGFIDKTGKEVISPQFTYAYDFSEGLAAVSKYINEYSTESGFINKQGIYAFPPSKIKNVTYIIKNDFKNGFAIIEGIAKNMFAYGGYYRGFGYISNTGQTLIVEGRSELFNFSEGLAKAQKSIGQRYGFINEKQKWIIYPIFDDAGDFIEGLAKVKSGSYWGFIDKTGKKVIPSQFTYAFDFSEGFAAVKTGQKFGFIDKSGNWIIKPELMEAKPFKNGIARVKFISRKGWNYIDKSGKILFTNFL